MTKVVEHNHSNKKTKKKNNGALVVIISLVAIIAILLGLNSFLSSKNKNNSTIVEKVSDQGLILGKKDAKFRLVEYADFQCPACATFSPILNNVFKDINAKYGEGTLSLTYKYFPLISIHQNALLSAYSAEAAKNQNKFWEMHDILFANQDLWGSALDAKSKIEGYARDLGLDMAKFVIDRDSQTTKDIVNASLKEATKLSLNHTPTIFLNGEELTNIDASKESIEKIIENKINLNQ